LNSNIIKGIRIRVVNYDRGIQLEGPYSKAHRENSNNDNTNYYAENSRA
jgi:hypothetical protein